MKARDLEQLLALEGALGMASITGDGATAVGIGCTLERVSEGTYRLRGAPGDVHVQAKSETLCIPDVRSEPDGTKTIRIFAARSPSEPLDTDIEIVVSKVPG